MHGGVSQRETGPRSITPPGPSTHGSDPYEANSADVSHPVDTANRQSRLSDGSGTGMVVRPGQPKGS